MSRLDYFTIFIVIVCILAIGLLLYQTTDLFKKKQPVEVELANTDYEDATTYELDTTDFMEEDTTDYWGDSDKIDEESDDFTTEEETAEKDMEAEDATETTNAVSADDGQTYPDGDAIARSGDYLVLGGTFSKMANAKKRLHALQDAGYTEAEIVLFDRGKYAVVLVNRFEDIGAARDLVAELKAKGWEAALYEKRH